MQHIHVGRLIEKLVEQKPMKKIDFAKAMNYSPGNISSLFNREDWPLSRVIEAGEVLNINILGHFVKSETATGSTTNMVMEESPVYKLNNVSKELQECRKDNYEKKELISLLLQQNKVLKQKIEGYETHKS